MKNITDAEIEFLSVAGMKSFLADQPERFEILSADKLPPNVGSLFWCETSAAALLLIDHYRTKDITACLLSDLTEYSGCAWVVHAEVTL